MTSIQSAAYVPPKIEERTPIDNPLIGAPGSGAVSAAFRPL